jgi:hypothetical protein
VRRLAVTPLLVLAVLAAAASALAAKGDPQERHTAADMARARSVLITRADLGRGWSARPQAESDGDIECSSMTFDESHLVETGAADSPWFSNGPLVGLSQGVSVYRTVAEAGASWRMAVRPQFPACVREAFDGKTISGVRLDVVRVSRVAFPSVAPRTAAYRLVATMTVAGRKLHARMDWILLGRGRTLTVLFFSGIEQQVPASFERATAGLVAKRLARAA